MRTTLPWVLSLALVACAEGREFLAPEDPGGGGAAGTEGGGAGSGNAGGGGQGGSDAGSGGSGGEAPGGNGGAGAGGDGGAGNGGAAAGTAGSSGAAGSGGTAGGGTAGSGAAGAGGSGAGGGVGGAAGQGGAGAAGVAGAGGDPAGGSGGQPFGGMNTDKICPPLPGDEGGAGGGAGAGIPGGFCPAEKLGNPNDDPCYTCWNGSRSGSCKGFFDACDASEDCLKFAACWSGCRYDEDKCFKNCAAEFPAGAAPYHGIRNCVYLTACPTVCAEQCKGIGSANRCNHDVCTTGYDLDPDCSPCAAKVCEVDSTCCAFEWDGSCRNKATSVCGLDCSNAPLPGCVHGECATGAPLAPDCSPCAAKVCAQHPLCCAPYGRWDLACAVAADELCG